MTKEPRPYDSNVPPDPFWYTVGSVRLTIDNAEYSKRKEDDK